MGRLSFVSSLIALAAFAALGPAQAANHIAISDQDCNAVLDAAATAPKTVPADLVKQCQDYLALAPAAGAAAAQAASAPADPCSGPNAAGSVYCWGDWSVLSPAAGPAAPDVNVDVTEQFPRPELASAFDPDGELFLPQGSCNAGGTCGFTTIVAGASGVGPASETAVDTFDMANDGTNFAVGDGVLASADNMTPTFTNRPDGLENMTSVGQDGDVLSIMIARVFRNNGPEIDYAADIWINADSGTGIVQSGNFVWGSATSQSDLDELYATVDPTMISFAGVMSGDVSTTASITLNVGGGLQAWNGTWTNPGYTFDAGGVIQGADLISSAGEFSSNVEGGYVQGALLGPLGDQAIAHTIDVVLDGVGEVRDVGFLLQQ